MPDPISSVSHGDISWPDQPSDRADFRPTIEQRADQRRYGVCGEPTTVIGALVCRDQLALSNVCRRAEPGTIDDRLCDDPALQEVQEWFTELAEKALQLLLGAKMGRAK